MVNALNDVDGSILDCKKSIEEFDNELLSLHTEIFDRIQEQFSNFDSEISNIIDLFDEFDVSDDKGIWSKEAIAQLGLLTQQYELAQYRVQQYNNEIDELNTQYLLGRYSATEYADKLADLNSVQWDAVNAVESAKDALIDLNETRIENQIAGIEKEINAYKELTDAQIEALKASKDLHDYENSIAEKTKSITDLERQIAAMQYDTSAATVAKRKQLEQQLTDAKANLEEAEYEHSIEAQEDALNKQYENYEKERNDEIEALRESLNDRETILAESFNTVKDNASLIGQEIASIATEHGVTVSNALISSWQSGENAIASYGEVLSQNTSTFIGNIMGVENEVWNLQAQANTTADSLVWMFSAKADNLVNELNTSYFAEANLANMTNALQQSLISTLERGYDVSSIVNSLNAVSDAANKASSAVNSLNTLSSANTSVPQSAIQHGITDGINTLYSSNNIDDINKWLNENKDIYSLGNVMTSASGSKTFKVSRYASGTRNADGGLRVIDEEGKELVLEKLSSGNYTIGNAGDQILTKAQTDNVFEWAKFNPEDFTLLGQEKFVESLRERSGNGRSMDEPMDFSALITPAANAHVMQEMLKNMRILESIVDRSVNNNSVNNYFDSMFKIEGDVIDAERITKRMEQAALKISHNEIVDYNKDFYEGIKYGSNTNGKWERKI